MIKASLFVLLAACAVDSTVDPSPDLEPIARPCSAFGCWENTATGPDGEVFDELDSTRKQANAHGVRIETFTLSGGRPAKVFVERDRLVATELNTGIRREGDELDDAIMVLSKDGLPAFEALFQVDTTGVQFWGGDTTDSAWVYDIRVRRLLDTGPGKPACRLPAYQPDWFGAPHAAVVFEGDRYDDPQHTVSDSVGSPWFNIACAGGYPAKLHLLRHTWAAGFGSDGIEHWPTKVWQRQAYLRAIVADYKGDGTSWTETGVRLDYGDVAGIHPIRSSGTLEAIWTEHGAECLNDPRRALRDVVDPGMSIPYCTGGEAGYVITVIPTP